MNRLIKKGIVLATIGFWIGLAIGVFISFLANGNADGPMVFTGEIFLKLLAGGIYGAIPMGGSVMYEIEEWSIFRATATHFVITFSGFIILAAVQGWLRLDNPVFWIISVAFQVCYFLIWLFNYLAYRKYIREMNDDIRAIRSNKQIN
ncbi:Protein of unknown function [Butyrivibrio sp. ob235]|uniref:DUF3021 domain-containing protein n=1 Tax=unclassified Butyrivibrio TaxID=2639466 RepID=UPI0003B41BFE|nr:MULTISPECIES: DUF3021 domain-containing protein [unclassified Butyrivibrio]SEL07034.1 Protein of unknown function [Butyrivibrio sp. ob235]